MPEDVDSEEDGSVVFDVGICHQHHGRRRSMIWLAETALLQWCKSGCAAVRLGLQCATDSMLGQVRVQLGGPESKPSAKFQARVQINSVRPKPKIQPVPSTSSRHSCHVQRTGGQRGG